MAQLEQLRPHWHSRMTFLLAAVGSAVGLGNIWKFPYVAGTQGGGAFVVVYLLCIALVGLPVLMAELYIGQKGQANAVTAFARLTDSKRTAWQLPGYLGVVSSVLILSFYGVVGGWVLNFLIQAATTGFSSLDLVQVKGLFAEMLASPLQMAVMQALFMLAVIAVVAAGVSAGLEWLNKLLMPALLVLLGVLLLRASSLSGFESALSFLFAVDLSKLSAEGVLEAVGHAFFTLSVGIGAILTYGSYVPPEQSLARTSVLIALSDTGVALVAGLVVFSAVFTYGFEPSAGPGLMFVTVPAVLAQMPGGHWFGTTFFLLVSFAALTSAVSMLQVVVAYFEEVFELSTALVAWVAGVLIFVLGLLPLLSFNVLAEVRVLGLNWFDLFDATTSQYLLPITGTLMSLFFGWKLKLVAAEQVVGKGFKAWFLLWSTRLIAPLAILVIMLRKILFSS